MWQEPPGPTDRPAHHQAREAAAAKVQKLTGATFIPPYNDIKIIAGQVRSLLIAAQLGGRRLPLCLTFLVALRLRRGRLLLSSCSRCRSSTS